MAIITYVDGFYTQQAYVEYWEQSYIDNIIPFIFEDAVLDFE